MRGIYRFYEDGRLVAVSENLITNTGRELIIKYLAGRSPGIAEVMVFGTMETPATVDDYNLGFQFEASLVDLGDYELDETSAKVIYRAFMDEDTTGEIHEVGLRATVLGADEDIPSEIVTRFDESQEDYEGGQVFESGRVGVNSLGLELDVSGEGELKIFTPGVDFSEYNSNDKFSLAYEFLSGTVNSVELRFETDDPAVYKYYNFTPNSGYDTEVFNKGDMSSQGSPDWANIQAITMVVTGNEGGSVAFDGLRLDSNTSDPAFGLVSRSVLDTPLEKRQGAEMQIEYAIDITI